MKSFRLLHLIAAAAVIAAYVTAEELGLVHAWLGYAIGAIVVLRLALAGLGAKGFTLHRLRPKLRAAPVGMGGLRHPAIAQVLTLALALNVVGLAATGIAMDQGGTLVGQSMRADDGAEEGGEDDEDSALLGVMIPKAHADDDSGGEADEGPLGEIHEALGSLLIPLVLAHVAYLLVFRFQMARFMLFLPARGSKR